MRLAVREIGKRLDFYEFTTWYDNNAFQEWINLSKGDMKVRVGLLVGEVERPFQCFLSKGSLLPIGGC